MSSHQHNDRDPAAVIHFRSGGSGSRSSPPPPSPYHKHGSSSSNSNSNNIHNEDDSSHHSSRNHTKNGQEQQQQQSPSQQQQQQQQQNDNSNPNNNRDSLEEDDDDDDHDYNLDDLVKLRAAASHYAQQQQGGGVQGGGAQGVLHNSNSSMGRSSGGSTTAGTRRPVGAITRRTSVRLFGPGGGGGAEAVLRAQRRQSVAHAANSSGATTATPQQPPEAAAVRSIEKGSDSWRGLLRPFVSDLCYQSLTRRHTFQAVSCQAALLFVDLSGYSRITSALQSQGAHVLSETVNAYLGRLLDVIVARCGGDVLKFAGDALLCAWAGDEQDLELNVLQAAECAVLLQARAGQHPVPGHPQLEFRIHCGLSCGPLESEIFEAETCQSMPRLFHYAGGEALTEIAELVDLAAAAQTCVSAGSIPFLEGAGVYRDLPNSGKNKNKNSGARLLLDLRLDRDIAELMEWHRSQGRARQAERRRQCGESMAIAFEEDFIHHSVLAALSHGGLSPTQIAQMRNLCVLFIAMTSQGSSTNWLLEVQSILDVNRCPIIQIILDDKGVHIVAAVNLYEAVPEAAVVGLEVCRALTRKRVGAAAGVAMGMAFCGVTGSQAACRWDVTGPSVVRAARLMQYALQHRTEFAIDQSLYEDPMAATRLVVLDPAVPLKGSAAPISVYTLSDAESVCAFRILDHGLPVHLKAVQQIQNHIGNKHRSGVLVTGIPLAGMRLVCQRVAGFSDMVPYLHLCEESAGFLQLARTVATWFRYCRHPHVRRLAERVVEDLRGNRWSCAHDQCVQLVQAALEQGLRACFLVDRIHNLDRFSLSLIRECLRRRPRRNHNTNCGVRKDNNSNNNNNIDEGISVALTRSVRRSTSSESIEAALNDDEHERAFGQICFLCTHTSHYSNKSAEDIRRDIVRSHTSFNILQIELKESSREELRDLFRALSDIKVEDRCLDAYAEASGYAAEYFLERFKAVQKMSAEKWKEGRPALVETSEDLIFHIPPRLVRKNKDIKVTEIKAEIAMLFSQIFDEIPPLCQMVLKIVTIATRRGFYKLPYKILSECMNDLIENGVERGDLDVIVAELVEICVIKFEGDDVMEPSLTDLLSIQNPALADTAMEVCTPIQIKSIAKVLVARLEPEMRGNYQVPLVVAGLHSLVGETDETKLKALWLQSYRTFNETSQGWNGKQINKWKEIMDDEIREISGQEAAQILNFMVQPRKLLSPNVAMQKLYVAPVSLGPMGLSFSVICRNTFHEFGIFHGASSPEQASRLREATGSACGRYMMQMTVLENYMTELGVGTPWDEIEAEMEMVSFLANPAQDVASVETKSVLILEEIIPRFVEHRLQRLYKLNGAVREQFKRNREFDLFTSCSKNRVLGRAYAALQAEKSRMDAAQDAIMILAVSNWKPMPIPEYLPDTHQQTVANIRNAVLKRLSDVEVSMFRHQQSVDDLEAFLVVTPLLQQATENGMC